MTLIPLLTLPSTLDYAAVGLLFLAWAGTGWIVEHPPASRPSVTTLMVAYRRTWMQEFVLRNPRLFDAAVVNSLRQGTAFFASACMIAIGGGAALIGNPERLHGLASDLTLPAGTSMLELKVLLVLFFVGAAFLKFVWAHRLFGYCEILMAAVPNDPEDPEAYPRAAQAAGINITAARSFNRGLRAVFFAMAALGWLLGGLALMLTTLATIGVILRAEFASASREVIMGRDPGRR